jgi:uncharacterized protein YdhG (YjbR/CyaY superfamily)
MMSTQAKAGVTTIDEYLATLPAPQRAALEALRRTIRAVAPQAEECISYQVPAFRLNGMLVGFGATPKHCTFFVMSTAVMEAHQNELAGYPVGKGSIRFQPDEPLPEALVTQLVRARIVENGAG